jgi:hypothetical protein
LVVVAAPREQDILPFPEDGLVNLQVAVVDMGNLRHATGCGKDICSSPWCF